MGHPVEAPRRPKPLMYGRGLQRWKRCSTQPQGGTPYPRRSSGITDLAGFSRKIYDSTGSYTQNILNTVLSPRSLALEPVRLYLRLYRGQDESSRLHSPLLPV